MEKWTLEHCVSFLDIPEDSGQEKLFQGTEHCVGQLFVPLVWKEKWLLIYWGLYCCVLCGPWVGYMVMNIHGIY